MLNKKKYKNRINLLLIFMIACIFSVMFVFYENTTFIHKNKAVLERAISKIDPNNVYVIKSIKIREDGKDKEIEKSYLFYNGYVIERYQDNEVDVARKYIGDSVYSYIDGSWYKETNRYEIPCKYNMDIHDFSGIKILNEPLYDGLKEEPVTFVCRVKEEEKSKYLDEEIKSYMKDVDLYLMITCENEKVKSISFTNTDHGTISYMEEYEEPENVLVQVPEYAVDVDMIEEAYGENAVSETGERPSTEKIALYDNFQNYLSDITIPAGFEYDSTISTKSEIFLNETDGYGEIIIKGKCDAIVEKMLTEGIYTYEENSHMYNLEFMFNISSKAGNVDLYKYTEDKDELGKTEYNIAITHFQDQIVELIFTDTKLEFSQDAIETFINYIL